jgi:hypothetical protein
MQPKIKRKPSSLSKRPSNNPLGRPKIYESTKPVLIKIPVDLVLEVKEQTKNFTEFVIVAIKEKLARG